MLPYEQEHLLQILTHFDIFTKPYANAKAFFPYSVCRVFQCISGMIDLLDDECLPCFLLESSYSYMKSFQTMLKADCNYFQPHQQGVIALLPPLNALFYYSGNHYSY